MKTLSQKQAIFAQNVAKLIEYIFSKGYLCSLGETYRTPTQAKIYADEGKGILNSLHCKRLAIDINLFSKNGKYFPLTEDYKPFGDYWESLHPSNRWGGTFKTRPDGNHMEMQDLDI
jgi:hypothetical protein